MKQIRRILYATDFSPASRRAFTAAVDLAKELHSALTIVSVVPPVMPMAPEVYVDAATYDRLEEQSRNWTAKRLKHLAGRASKAGARVATTLRSGDPVAQIVRAAKSAHADLMVVGTHGRGAIPKFFLGSVAERVVKMAPCPVLTVRGTSRA